MWKTWPKKDFHHLRESEGKANSRQDLSMFRESDGRIFRTKMAVYLALLHSSNRTCSSIIYQLLEDNLKDALTVMDDMDDLAIQNILLVLSMAMNHPAFSYHQKTKMYEYYRKANEESDRILKKPADDMTSSLILSESCEMRPCDQQLSPMCSPRLPVHPPHSPQSPAKVHVCNIEVKGSRQRDKDKRTEEYKLQVTWSNGEKTEVYRTYQELMDFHNKLMERIPEGTKMPQRSFKLPVSKGTKNHKKEHTENMNQYASCLTNLPRHMVQSNFFSNFFESAVKAAQVVMADAATSPRPQTIRDIPSAHLIPNSGDEEPVINTQTKNQSVYNSCLGLSPVNGEVGSLSPQSPAHPDVAFHNPAHSPVCSTKMTSPLISSQCQSPGSSCSSRPGSPLSLEPVDPSPGSNTVGSLLKSNNLAIYADLFSPFTIEQLSKMSCEEMEGLSDQSLTVSRDVAARIKGLVEAKAREKLPCNPNGLIEAHVPNFFWQTHLPTHQLAYPAPAVPVPFHASHPPPQPHHYFPTLYNIAPIQAIGVPAAGPDGSASNSEHSSPSPSPHPPQGALKISKLVYQDSSSDDSEKTKIQGQGRIMNSKGKCHSAPNSARSLKREDEAKLDTNSNSSTPPLSQDKTDINVSAGNYSNGNYSSSGYTSDPTFNATRPMPPRPAPTNMNIPPNCIISMPDKNGGFQQCFPSAVPQHLRDGTMTTAAGSHVFNMLATEPGHRPYYHAQMPFPFMRSPVNPSGARPVFGTRVHVNPNSSLNQASAVSSAGNKVFQGPQVVLPQPGAGASKTTVILNGTDSSLVTQHGVEPCTHRHPVIPSTSTPSSLGGSLTTSVSQAMPSSHSHATCWSCGGTGHNPQPPYYQPMQHSLMHQHYPNGIVQPMIIPPYPNGVHNDILFSQQQFGFTHSGSPGVGGGVPAFTYNYTGNPGPGLLKKPKKINCHNCGSSKHTASDCQEVSMEAMSGPSLYTYKPKTDSE